MPSKRTSNNPKPTQQTIPKTQSRGPALEAMWCSGIAELFSEFEILLRLEVHQYELVPPLWGLGLIAVAPTRVNQQQALSNFHPKHMRHKSMAMVPTMPLCTCRDRHMCAWVHRCRVQQHSRTRVGAPVSLRHGRATARRVGPGPAPQQHRTRSRPR